MPDRDPRPVPDREAKPDHPRDRETEVVRRLREAWRPRLHPTGRSE